MDGNAGNVCCVDGIRSRMHSELASAVAYSHLFENPGHTKKYVQSGMRSRTRSASPSVVANLRWGPGKSPAAINVVESTASSARSSAQQMLLLDSVLDASRRGRVVLVA